MRGPMWGKQFPRFLYRLSEKQWYLAPVWATYEIPKKGRLGGRMFWGKASLALEGRRPPCASRFKVNFLRKVDRW